MDLEALRAQARAVATRMETRIDGALKAGRDMTADEEAAHAADLAELADLKAQIATAEQGGTPENPADPADPVAAATAAERSRILALADLCPSSVVASPLRAAIESGQDAGAFAIGLAAASKARGASMADLRRGAVQEEQLPTGRGSSATSDKKPLTGKARSDSILARASALGHKAVAHLATKG